jgi:hypothetical protein
LDPGTTNDIAEAIDPLKIVLGHLDAHGQSVSYRIRKSRLA